MSGWLVLVVGASGVGKDTLLGFARARLAQRTDIVFARRVITRPADGTEAHEPVDEAEFAARRGAGGFALDWRAHGLHYGIPKSIETDLAAGRTVIANVSRGIVEAARGRFACFVIEIVADRDLLAGRLQRRGRETADDIATRLRRDAAIVQPDAVIANDGSIEAGGLRLLDLIESLPTYSGAR
jgi:phosphonate metabolism protein PhnN/1,5-bisphosphokinase (PRPP-forming)